MKKLILILGILVLTLYPSIALAASSTVKNNNIEREMNWLHSLNLGNRGQYYSKEEAREYLKKNVNVANAKDFQDAATYFITGKNNGRIFGKGYKELKGKELISLDLANTFDLLENGYIAGYATEKETNKYCIKVASMAKKHFKTYDDYSLNYLSGLNNLDIESSYIKDVECFIKTQKTDRTSIWNTVPWGNY